MKRPEKFKVWHSCIYHVALENRDRAEELMQMVGISPRDDLECGNWIKMLVDVEELEEE